MKTRLVLFVVANVVVFILIALVKTNTASVVNTADIKLMQQQLLDAQSNAQIRNLYSIGVKMLKRMQIQNEQNALNLDECYERLGKFTRLMVVNNKRRALAATNNNNKLESLYRDESSEYQQQQNLLPQNNNNNKLNADPQSSFSLLNEINFYL